VATAKHFRRVVIIVLDGVGIGAQDDAAAFDDADADSIGNIVRGGRKLKLPHLAARGLGKVTPLPGLEDTPVMGAYGVVRMASPGKDSIDGHWELAGVARATPFPLFPQGFPAACVAKLRRAIGRELIGNKAASGTAIIEELGREHLRTGALILYTSADSVCQLAAHVAVIGVAELHELGARAREVMTEPYAVARVIVRPFEGEPGRFRRLASGRRDFALPPPPTLLDLLQEAGYTVFGVGKVDDLFAGRGFSACEHVADNAGAARALRRRLADNFRGLLLANFNDTDTVFGHRNDVAGYARALEEFDANLPRIEKTLRDDDLLIIMSDHGNDPTTPSTDHSREYTPLLSWHRRLTKAVPLGVRKTLADVGQTAADNFNVGPLAVGASFLDAVLP